MQTLALPDTHLSCTTATQGSPRTPTKGRWVLRSAVFTHARVQPLAQRAIAFCAEISSYPSGKKEL